jgi:hypothetical protein
MFGMPNIATGRIGLNRQEPNQDVLTQCRQCLVCQIQTTGRIGLIRHVPIKMIRLSAANFWCTKYRPQVE